MSVVLRLVGMLPTSWTAAAARARWRGPRVRRLVDWAAGRLKHRDSVVQTGVGRGLRFNTGPANARLVEHDAALNGFAQVEVRRIASGATDGDAAFHAPAESTMGRLASVGPGVGTLVEDTVVPLRRLDTVMRDADRPPRPDFIKIDVEGATADVLAGAAETLRDARPILLIDLHHTAVTVDRAVASLGYCGTVIGSLAAVRDAAFAPGGGGDAP